MQTSPLRFVLLLLAAAALTLGLTAADKEKKSDKKGPDLTLEDVIFDAGYLKKFVGANTLVVPDEKTGQLPTAGLLKAALEKSTKIYALPDQAEKPKLDYSMPPTFPRSLRLSRGEAIKARYLAIVGPDGTVKCLYCYETNDEPFAIVTANAVIHWRYKPAKLNGTAVPVMVPIEMEFTESMAAVNTFRGPKSPNVVKGEPPALPPVRPGANNAPR
jgi:hypothetical protein